jgi:hypothetical protein
MQPPIFALPGLAMSSGYSLNIITIQIGHYICQWYKGVLPEYLAPKPVHLRQVLCWRDNWWIGRQLQSRKERSARKESGGSWNWGAICAHPFSYGSFPSYLLFLMDHTSRPNCLSVTNDDRVHHSSHSQA